MAASSSQIPHLLSESASSVRIPNAHYLKLSLDELRKDLFEAIKNDRCNNGKFVGINTGVSIIVCLHEETVRKKNISRVIARMAELMCLVPKDAPKYPFISIANYLECFGKLLNIMPGMLEKPHIIQICDDFKNKINETIAAYKATLNSLHFKDNKGEYCRRDLYYGYFNFEKSLTNQSKLHALEKMIVLSAKYAIRDCDKEEHVRSLIMVGINVCDESLLLETAQNHYTSCVSLVLDTVNHTFSLYFLSKLLHIIIQNGSSRDVRSLLNYGVCLDKLITAKILLSCISLDRIRYDYANYGDTTFIDKFSLLFSWSVKNNLTEARILLKNPAKIIWPDGVDNLRMIIGEYANAEKLSMRDGMDNSLMYHILNMIRYRCKSDIETQTQALSLIQSLFDAGIKPNHLELSRTLGDWVHCDKQVYWNLLIMLINHSTPATLEKVKVPDWIVKFALVNQDFQFLDVLKKHYLMRSIHYPVIKTVILERIAGKKIEKINRILEYFTIEFVFENAPGSHEILLTALNHKYEMIFIQTLLLQGVLKTTNSQAIIQACLIEVIQKHTAYMNLFLEAAALTHAKVPWDELLRKSAEDIYCIPKAIRMGCRAFLTPKPQSQAPISVQNSSHLMGISLIHSMGGTTNNHHLHLSDTVNQFFNHNWGEFIKKTPRRINTLKVMCTDTIFKHSSLFNTYDPEVNKELKNGIELSEEIIVYALAFLCFLRDSAVDLNRATIQFSIDILENIPQNVLQNELYLTEQGIKPSN